MKFNSMLVFYCLVQFLGVAHASVTIIGGKKVSAKEAIAHTVVALVSSSSKGQALCTASLVGQNLAITAAHCIVDQAHSQKSLYTLIFSTDLRHALPTEMREIDQVRIPAEWKPRKTLTKDTSDVALVHFVGSMPDGYQFSKLLPFDHDFIHGDTVEIAGFGISNAIKDNGEGVLRKTQVHVLDPHYSNSEVSFDQTEGGGACHGDSGGPAYVIIKKTPYLFGITSRGGGNCDQDVIYTKISAYQDWFTRAVASLRK